MIPRELLQIISYLDIQIKAIEQEYASYQKQNIPMGNDTYYKLVAKSDALEQTKKWILEKFSE